jgi:hypothetical protein
MYSKHCPIVIGQVNNQPCRRSQGTQPHQRGPAQSWYCECQLLCIDTLHTYQRTHDE